MTAEKGTFSTAKEMVWWEWAHPPFHYFGLLPFLLGTSLAWRLSHRFSLPVLLLSLTGIALVITATHAIAIDRRGSVGPASPPDGPPAGPGAPRASASTALRVGMGSLVLAVAAALMLQFVFHTGPLTFPMGCLGALPGLCYATRACRWLDRGLGEWVFSLCYGWLPIAAGFYLQTGTVFAGVHAMAVPVGLSLLNVILIHEYATAPPMGPGAVNLLATLGKTGGMVLHIAVSLACWLWMLGLVCTGQPKKLLYLYLPVMALSLVVSLMMALRKYDLPFSREWIVGLNTAIYLGTILAFVLAYF